MKASELRIGNFVRRRFAPNEEPLDFTVTAILADVEYPFEGIPLTPEWLTKFGFVQIRAVNERSIDLYWVEKDIVPILHLQTEDGLINVFKKGYNELNHIGGAKYVHQLQNLYFALTGKELELKEKP